MPLYWHEYRQKMQSARLKHLFPVLYHVNILSVETSAALVQISHAVTVRLWYPPLSAKWSLVFFLFMMRCNICILTLLLMDLVT